MISFKKAALATVAASIAISGTAVLANSETSGADESMPQATGARQVRSVPPGQASRFAELRRTNASSDDLPAGVAQSVNGDGSLAAQFGVNTKVVRRASNNTWILPGDGALCIAQVDLEDESTTIACNTETHATTQGVVIWQRLDAGRDGDGVVSGVVPDDVDSVQLLDRSGGSRSARVTRNAFAAETTATTEAVTFIGADGTRYTQPRPPAAPDVK
jgi:hypothetical protein